MSANPNRKIRRPPAWNCGCKDTIIFGEMQIKIAFWCDFFSGGGGDSRGRKRKAHNQKWEIGSAGNRREHNSREEGERQYRMYQSDRKGPRGEIREH